MGSERNFDLDHFLALLMSGNQDQTCMNICRKFIFLCLTISFIDVRQTERMRT